MLVLVSPPATSCSYPLSLKPRSVYVFFFFFNDTATPEIYPFSLHDALPICGVWQARGQHGAVPRIRRRDARRKTAARSEEHTSELQSRQYLVCRLLLEQ